MIVSTTMASEMELFGNATAPVTLRFVDVTLVRVLLVLVKLVNAPVVAMNEVAKRLVLVAFVNTPAAGVTRPIGVLLMVPASMVRPFTTIVSVIELAGRFNAPDTAKLVVVALVVVKLTPLAEVNINPSVLMFVLVMFAAVTFVGLKFVVASVVKNPFVEVMEVPFAVPKVVERKFEVVAKRLVVVIEVPTRGPLNVPPVRRR